MVVRGYNPCIISLKIKKHKNAKTIRKWESDRIIFYTKTEVHIDHKKTTKPIINYLLSHSKTNKHWTYKWQEHMDKNNLFVFYMIVMLQ